MYSMANPCMHTTSAFRLIEEDFKGAIHEGLSYICDICRKFEFRSNVLILHDSKYQIHIYNKCTTGKSYWICKCCLKSLLKN